MSVSSGKTPVVLVAPLDWGLGHSTRCIPVITLLAKKGCRVIVAADGARKALLKKEFPDLTFVSIVNYNITYSRSPLFMALKFPLMILRVVLCFFIEHIQLSYLIRKHAINGVISDQRFGCFSKKIPSVYITHQLMLKLPHSFSWLEPVIALGLRYAATQYDHVWVPDLHKENSLAGDLVHKLPLPPNCRFVGILSRFSSGAKRTIPQRSIDLLIMLSGPEPQRSMLERIILSQIRDFRGHAVVLLGKPGAHCDSGSQRILILSHASSEEIESLIRSAKSIVCRGGYTTIMELVSLNKSAILIPTPGQTEQEYLCEFLSKKGLFVFQRQQEFNLVEALGMLSDLSSLQKNVHVNDEKFLRQAIGDFVNRICLT